MDLGHHRLRLTEPEHPSPRAIKLRKPMEFFLHPALRGKAFSCKRCVEADRLETVSQIAAGTTMGE